MLLNNTLTYYKMKKNISQIFNLTCHLALPAERTRSQRQFMSYATLSPGMGHLVWPKAWGEFLFPHIAEFIYTNYKDADITLLLKLVFAIKL